MSTVLARRPGGWASLVLLFLCLNLTTCQQTDTYKFLSTPATFQGFYPTGTSVRQVNCLTNYKWLTSSTFGVCCASASCVPFTTCASGILTLGDGTRVSCHSTVPSCFARTVYPASPHTDAATSWIYHFCTTSHSISTLYREIVPRETTPATTAQIITTGGSTITIGPSSKTTSAPDAEVDAEGDDASGAEPGANPGKGDSRSKETGTPAAVTETASPSKAWIAGAVLGPLALIAAGVFLYIWLVGRRGERKTSAGGEALEQQPPAAGNPQLLYSPGPEKYHEMPVYGYYKSGEPQQYSLLSPVLHELPQEGVLVHELPPAQRPAELAGR